VRRSASRGSRAVTTRLAHFLPRRVWPHSFTRQRRSKYVAQCNTGERRQLCTAGGRWRGAGDPIGAVCLSISQIHIVAVTQRLQIPYSWDHERQEGRTPSARTADHRSPSTACSTAVVSCVRHKKRSDEIAPLHCYASHMSQASDARDALTPDGRPRPGRSVALSLSLSLKCHLKAP
jgi:hypothetical protein